ncbi:dihydrofolate reductase [Coraliomargarita sinensis]|uniref:Dihydrofolate reductase n=1 Tax=Coraliomargarita sinensis TaxID=2174842 RepID=A0A317ZP75_9BACT|nr:dihydrofolate reductase [Coraliomargarita sinensis]PXA05161.1 dihydrofolate reductase [Coraliomargarita sinensis]
MKHFKAIAAMSENRVIGSDGDMPWNLPEDFKWFKQATMGGIMIMGRKTYESIGKPLPGRETYVLSRRELDIPGVTNITDISALQDLETDKTVWIAGGAEIYRQTLDDCDEVYLTRVHRQCEGDTFFPEFEDRFDFDEVLQKNEDFTIERWVRRQA